MVSFTWSKWKNVQMRVTMKVVTTMKRKKWLWPRPKLLLWSMVTAGAAQAMQMIPKVCDMKD